MMEGGEEDTGNGVFCGRDCREKGKVKNLLQNGKMHFHHIMYYKILC